MKSAQQLMHRCDHCNKLYQVGPACLKHEKYCPRNPVNIPKCSDCVFFHQTPIVINTQRGFFRDVNAFFCEKMGIGVYPVKAARQGLPEKHPETFEDQIQMPSECELYEQSKEYVFPL